VLPTEGGWRIEAGDITTVATGIVLRGDATRATISVSRAGALAHRDRVTVTSAKSRVTFVRDVVKKGIALDERALLAIDEAIRRAETSDCTSTGAPDLPRPSASPTGVPAGVPYAATPEGVIWYKPTRDDVVTVPLTNFRATIVQDIAEDDGVEIRRAFMIEAGLNGSMKCFTIPASGFATMTWPSEHLGARAVVFAGMGLRDHARAAIQLLSGQVSERRVYSHLGWRFLSDAWVYLHAGGAIGPLGPVPGVEVAVGDACARFILTLPPDNSALVDAVRASLRMLAVAPRRITVPILAAVARAVLGGVDFSIHLTGATGVCKSELAALAQQHSGAGMDARRPCFMDEHRERS
jgi:hypothetical protein